MLISVNRLSIERKGNERDLETQSGDKKPRLLIDLDGVIRDFIKQLENVYIREYPDHSVKRVISRELHKFFPIGNDIYQFLEDQFGDEIVLNAPPYPGAIEALRKWEKDFELVIVTAQPDNWRYATFAWIGNHRIPTNEVKIIFEKHTVDGFALLDDFTDNLELFAKTNRLAVCLDQPWNQNWQGPRVKTVEDFFQLVEKEINTD